MTYGYQVLLALHVVSAAMLIALLGLVAMNRREPLAPWLAGVFAALLLWTVAYIFELASGTLAGKLAWANPQFIGATVMPLLWLLAMRRAAGARRLPVWLTAALWLGCLAIIACACLNPGHLFRGHPALDHSGPVPFLAADYGPLYHLLWVPFAYGLLIVALITLARGALRGPVLVHARCRLLLAATLLPMLVGVLFIAGLLPWPNFNPAIGSLSISAALCGVALVRYRLLSITPLARETVIEQLADALVVVDARGLLCDFNPAASRMLPELSPEALGRPLGAVLAARAELAGALREARCTAESAAPPTELETAAPAAERERTLPLVVTTGTPEESELRYFNLRITPIVRRAGLHIGAAILLHDVTESRRLYLEARRLASTDELTGLLSRRRLLELGAREVARARRRGRSLGLLLLDLDHFKLINDAHGHAAGDQVLRELAACCGAELRNSDLLGRHGGDEICAVLPDLEEAAACATAERLREAVASLEVRYAGELIPVTVSVGVVAARVSEETTLDQLMRMADESLYEAKRAGRDRVAAAWQKGAIHGRTGV